MKVIARKITIIRNNTRGHYALAKAQFQLFKSVHSMEGKESKTINITIAKKVPYTIS